jgi:hypothetical protein
MNDHIGKQAAVFTKLRLMLVAATKMADYK